MRCAAVRLPPDEVDTYWERERPRLARSLPPELAKREKLLRAAVYRSSAAGGGIGGRGGGVGRGGGASGDGLAGSGAAGGSGVGGGLPSDDSQLGMSGVPPPWPEFAFEVPINVSFLDFVSAMPFLP
jgi:hypothetical protein